MNQPIQVGASTIEVGPVSEATWPHTDNPDHVVHLAIVSKHGDGSILLLTAFQRDELVQQLTAIRP